MLFTNLGICCQQHTHTRTPSAEQKHISALAKQIFSFFRLRKEVHSNTQQSECPLTGCHPACGFTYGLSKVFRVLTQVIVYLCVDMHTKRHSGLLYISSDTE